MEVNERTSRAVEDPVACVFVALLIPNMYDRCSVCELGVGSKGYGGVDGDRDVVVFAGEILWFSLSCAKQLLVLS